MVDVSVVLPTCNRPLLLKRALQSVFTQKTDDVVECIVIDDGNALQSPVIRAIVEETGARYMVTDGGQGGGGGKARNTGIRVARGTYVAFLDDDDAWEQDKLARQIRLMKDRSLRISYTGLYIISNRNRRRYSFRSPPDADYYRAIMRRNFIGTTSSVIVSKEALTETGGFDTTLPALQDYDLYIRLLQKKSLEWISDPLTRYYNDETVDKISGSRERFHMAVRLLSEKYGGEQYFRLLKRSFFEITILKCVRSRRFLLETICSIVKR
jgi:glycosyltransferase involved in cell wall biosynthesis